MDAVYLWVDGNDSRRRSVFESYKPQAETRSIEDVGSHRFHDLGELKYSLRSIEKYAPWIERIFVVTDGQRPTWANSKQLRFVLESELFSDPAHLPTFNSTAVESNLHRIPTLSRHFLAFNDDFLFGQPVDSTDFIDADGTQQIYWGSLGFEGDSRILDFKGSQEGHALSDAERKLLVSALGSWIPSMQHAAMLLDHEYGSAQRRSIAHLPFLLDTKRVRELEARWPAVFENNSAHRFRCAEDVQVQFFYFNFLLAEAARTHRVSVRPVYARGDPQLYGTVEVGSEPDPVTAFFRQSPLPKFFNIAPTRHLSNEAAQALTESLARIYPDKSRFEL